MYELDRLAQLAEAMEEVWDIMDELDGDARAQVVVNMLVTVVYETGISFDELKDAAESRLENLKKLGCLETVH